MSKWLRVHACMLLAASMPLTALADLYGADEAYRKQDFPRSFELYRELAELGQLLAQENLAAMYVGGEGVKRDNVLGYAWAVIAKENGGSAAMQNIITQLEPHMTPAARTRVAALQAQFGMAALQERLLLTPKSLAELGSSTSPTACKMRTPVNPDDYYPEEAKRDGISGSADVDVEVAPDGRARNVRVLYSLPARWFDAAGMRVALDSSYTAPTVNGRRVPCRIRFRVKFSSLRGGGSSTAVETPEQQKARAEVREKAAAGDPRSQLNYGLLLDTRSGLNVDNELASTWFLKAAQAGIPTAQYLVGRQLLFTPTPEKSVAKGLAWLQRAADAGQSDAQAVLANYLLRQDPSAENFSKAQALLEKSAASGNPDGKYHYAALLAAGPDAAQRDPQQALALIQEVMSEVMSEVKLYPTSFEIRAAAQAMLGDFAGAQETQTRALKMARKMSWDTKDQEARLASYAASKPWTGDLFAY
jgi:TonB family protein